jgi:hypothetical protein
MLMVYNHNQCLKNRNSRFLNESGRFTSGTPE